MMRAELSAGDHQRGHDQRVQGDRRLDPGDRGAQVGRHGGHRHVHHRAVQRHQELAARKYGQDQTGAGLRGRRRRCWGCHPLILAEPDFSPRHPDGVIPVSCASVRKSEGPGPPGGRPGLSGDGTPPGSR